MSVYDIEDYTVDPDSNSLDIDFSMSQCALALSWRTVTSSGVSPVWYEWSVGVSGHTIGGNLLDVHNEPIWRETSKSNMAVYTTGSSQKSGRWPPSPSRFPSAGSGSEPLLGKGIRVSLLYQHVWRNIVKAGSP